MLTVFTHIPLQFKTDAIDYLNLSLFHDIHAGNAKTNRFRKTPSLEWLASAASE